MGTSFAVIVRSLASHPRSAQGSGRPAAAAAAAAPGAVFSSQRFTPSRHASLLRAAGALPSDSGASAELPTPQGSPASTGSVAVPVVIPADVLADVETEATHGHHGIEGPGAGATGFGALAPCGEQEEAIRDGRCLLQA